MPCRTIPDRLRRRLMMWVSITALCLIAPVIWGWPTVCVVVAGGLWGMHALLMTTPGDAIRVPRRASVFIIAVGAAWIAAWMPMWTGASSSLTMVLVRACVAGALSAAASMWVGRERAQPVSPWWVVLAAWHPGVWVGFAMSVRTFGLAEGWTTFVLITVVCFATALSAHVRAGRWRLLAWVSWPAVSIALSAWCIVRAAGV